MSSIKVGVIGGTGLADILRQAGQGRRHDVDTPFGRPSDSIVESEIEGLSVLLLSRHGPGHMINPSAVPFRANIFALKQLGCTHILASGAVGSLRQEFKPRNLIVVDQIIDKTFKRANTFYEKAAVHVEFAEPFCPVLRRILIDEGAALATEGGFAVHDRGCYVCMEGPAFSTRAESLMHRLWGGDVIGMTAMPEAKLAREAEISYALVALSTDYDSWKARTPPVPAGSTGTATTPAPVDPMALLEEIRGNLKAASTNAMELIRRAIKRIAAQPAALENCPASQALRLAIWSDKDRIDREEVARLSPLWGRYFG